MRIEELTFDQAATILMEHICCDEWEKDTLLKYFCDFLDEWEEDNDDVIEKYREQIEKWRKTDTSKKNPTTHIWDHLTGIQDILCRFHDIAVPYHCLICEYGHVLKKNDFEEKNGPIFNEEEGFWEYPEDVYKKYGFPKENDHGEFTGCPFTEEEK